MPAKLLINRLDRNVDLNRSFFVLLTILANQITTTGTATFRKRHGLASSDWKVLSIVSSLPGCSGAEVADVLSMDRGAISRTIHQLAHKGLVRIERTAKAGNYRAIEPTEAGRQIHAEAFDTALERERRMVDGLSGEVRHEMVAGLQKMARNMDKVSRLADEPPKPLRSWKGIEHMLAATGDSTEYRSNSLEPASADAASNDAFSRIELENAKMRKIIIDLTIENADLRQLTRTAGDHRKL